MYRDQDPLNKIYSYLITESTFGDFRRDEASDNKLRITPGFHQYRDDEVTLKNGDLVPGDVEFLANWREEEFGHSEGIGRYQSSTGGFYVDVVKVSIPKNVSMEDVNRGVIHHGLYKPGMNLLSLLDTKEIEHITDTLTQMFNDRERWSEHNHY